MTNRSKTFDGLAPSAQEQWRELSELPPAQALSRMKGVDPAPPLTEADPLSEWIARIVFAFPSGDSRRDDIRVLAARALALESELARLRREKSEREGLYRRRDEWLTLNTGYMLIHNVAQWSGAHRVTFADADVVTSAGDGTGPTYEAALAAALEKLRDG